MIHFSKEDKSQCSRKGKIFLEEECIVEEEDGEVGIEAGVDLEEEEDSEVALDRFEVSTARYLFHSTTLVGVNINNCKEY